MEIRFAGGATVLLVWDIDLVGWTPLLHHLDVADLDFDICTVLRSRVASIIWLSGLAELFLAISLGNCWGVNCWAKGERFDRM
jgi:hypothetical protein